MRSGNNERKSSWPPRRHQTSLTSAPLIRESMAALKRDTVPQTHASFAVQHLNQTALLMFTDRKLIMGNEMVGLIRSRLQT